MAIRSQTILTCDYIIRHEDGRFTLVGIFRNIVVKEFPAVKDPMGVYVELQGDQGDPFEVVLCMPNGREDVINTSVIEHPLRSAEGAVLSTTIGGPIAMAFAEEGEYIIAVRSAGESISEYRFSVMISPAAGEESDHGTEAYDGV